MNPESLENYKRKVYNPGSPYPDPEVEPLDILPNYSLIDPNNPLKLTIGKRKRFSASEEFQEESSQSTPKKNLHQWIKKKCDCSLKISKRNTRTK